MDGDQMIVTIYEDFATSYADLDVFGQTVKRKECFTDYKELLGDISFEVSSVDAKYDAEAGFDLARVHRLEISCENAAKLLATALNEERSKW